jgi:ABC-2 type transport system ATP-binding protein
MTTVLAFHEIARSFKHGTPVLDGVTFSVNNDEVVGVLGRNGAGKTTLIHIAMGMLFPHAGTVRVFGISPTEDPVAVKKRIGYVAEDQVLPPTTNIAELVAFHKHIFPDWDRALEKQLLERFGLAGNASKIKQLSKGQARQVALILAVCHRPELLILDEPAGGLDPAARREFLETSIQLLNREGSAILFSSHHMGDVERLGGRVILLDEGKVLVDRQLDDLRENHCVAIIPRRQVAEQAALERLPGCLRVRSVFEDWHVVFQAAPEAVRTQLAQSLGLTGVQCSTVPLEELFIELVGGERMVEAS